jgi:hypothetical protein
MFRLLSKDTKENYKVEGYEKFDNGVTYHSRDGESWNPALHAPEEEWNYDPEYQRYNLIVTDHYIRHCRKDRWIGTSIDGERVFTGDKIEQKYYFNGEENGSRQWVVRSGEYTIKHTRHYSSKNIGFYLDGEDRCAAGTLLDYKERGYKITGIEGVPNKEV